jgi:hypothetical protein
VERADKQGQRALQESGVAMSSYFLPRDHKLKISSNLDATKQEMATQALTEIQ